MTQNSAGYEMESVAKNYIKYRQKVPTELFDIIISYHDNGSQHYGRRGVAVDVGCGSGQSIIPLSKHFKSVVGVDPSEAQLEEGKQFCADHPNIAFRLGSAEKLSWVLEKESVDLVSAGSALHWFDIEEFFAECLQIVKPGGTVSAYILNIPRWYNEHADDIIHNQIFRGIFEKYWLPGIKHVHTNYSEALTIMRSYFEETARNDSIKVESNFSVEEVFGFIKSFPQYVFYKREYPDHPDGVDKALKNLMTIFGTNSTTEKMIRGYSVVSLIMGRKPQTVL